MKKTYVFSILLYASFLSGEQEPSVELKYPKLAITEERKICHIPFVTMLPTRGDSAIASKQILAGIENALRENKPIQIPNHKPYKLVHETNYGLPGEIPSGHFKQLLTKSPLIVGAAGIESFLSIEQKIRDKKTALFFPFIGSPLIRNKVFENVIYFRPSHEEEIKALANYAINKKHKTMIGVLYENSKMVLQSLKGLKDILANYDAKIVCEAAYAQGTVDINHALKKLSGANPNVVFLYARPRAAYTFVSNAVNTGLHAALFVGPSSLHSIQRPLQRARGINIALTEVVPNAATTKIPLIDEYKKDMENFLAYREDSPMYLESYIGIKILTQLLTTLITSKKEITIPALIAAAEEMKNYDLGGLKLSFDPATRTLSNNLWINPGAGEPWIPAHEGA